MSTDQLDTPLLEEPRRQGYAYIQHHNSNNCRRRGRKSPTIQTIKHSEGGPLPHVPFLTKHNRHTPHVGKKQLAKAGR